MPTLLWRPRVTASCSSNLRTPSQGLLFALRLRRRPAVRCSLLCGSLFTAVSGPGGPEMWGWVAAGPRAVAQAPAKAQAPGGPPPFRRAPGGARPGEARRGPLRMLRHLHPQIRVRIPRKKKEKGVGGRKHGSPSERAATSPAGTECAVSSVTRLRPRLGLSTYIVLLKAT